MIASSLIFYVLAALGALSVYCLMPSAGYRLTRGRRALGTILGAAALAGLIVWLIGLRQVKALMPADEPLVGPFFYLFAAVAIASAVRVVVHPRPVYSALYFVLTVLAVAGVLLLAGGEFLAIVLIIIYAGAIMVTYVFVIMLAQQAHSGDLAGSASYDVRTRPAFVPLLLGFLLLAALGGPLSSRANWPKPESPASVNAAPALAKPLIEDQGAASDAAGPVMTAAPQGNGPDTDAPAPGSIESIGEELMHRHVLAIELAGVLLLVAIVGAVALARRRVEPADLLVGPIPDPRSPAPGKEAAHG
ncbi:MAG: hypothetical protein BIFFINMI_01030 [Phycisphaerae bacterium]|nr:hypothetical protein [Phycisphaerae bacterium]